MMFLTVVTPPATELVSLDEAKDRLRVTSTDNDQAIAGHITAAREFAERVSNRSLAAKDYAGVIDRFPMHEPIRVPLSLMGGNNYR